MPLYVCNSVQGTISEEAKEKIAAEITSIQCEVIGSRSDLVHMFFFEDAPQRPLNGMRVLLFGSIRGERSDEEKHALAVQMKRSIQTHADVALNEIIVDVSDVPSGWVLEGSGTLLQP